MDSRSEVITHADGSQTELATVIHDGHEFTNLGAIITDGFVAGYLAKDGQLTDWQGNQIGTYRIVSTWKTPRSYVSSEMHAVHATVGGKTFKGRSAGIGMLFRGKLSL